jgi:hypothetical protein
MKECMPNKRCCVYGVAWYVLLLLSLPQSVYTCQTPIYNEKPIILPIQVPSTLFSFIPQRVRPSFVHLVIGELPDNESGKQKKGGPVPDGQKKQEILTPKRSFFGRQISELKQRIINLCDGRYLKQHWLAGLSVLWGKEKMPALLGRYRPKLVNCGVRLQYGGREILGQVGVKFDKTIWPKNWGKWCPCETASMVTLTTPTCFGGVRDCDNVSTSKAFVGVKWDEKIWSEPVQKILNESGISMTASSISGLLLRAAVSIKRFLQIAFEVDSHGPRLKLNLNVDNDVHQNGVPLFCIPEKKQV